MQDVKLLSQHAEEEAVRTMKSAALSLEKPEDLDLLIDKIGDSRIVLLGEASHGTHEYYMWRNYITRRLISEKNFSFVAAEADWPDAYQINRYVKGYRGAGKKAKDVLQNFNRWPTWMWANWETEAFAEWLRRYNDGSDAKHKTGFYGLDVYSLQESLEYLAAYLKATDKEAYSHVQKVFNCFEPYGTQEGLSYAVRNGALTQSCETEAVALLAAIRSRQAGYNTDPEASLNAEQNAVVAVNAEKYYRAMIKAGPLSWNLRDLHMADSLDRLLKFHGKQSKAIIWAHNTHIGDARATDMVEDGMLNLGQLLHEQFHAQGVYSVGMGSYKGRVMASNRWSGKPIKMDMPPARDGSWEKWLEDNVGRDCMVFSDDLRETEFFEKRINHRAIGVVYLPGSEEVKNYVPSVIPERYQAFLYFKKTHPLHAMHVEPDGLQLPETYPWGL